MTDDVVAELDAWLGAWEGPDDYRLTVQRARDLIVALDEMRKAHIRMLSANRDETRNDALEEAARMCEGGYTTGSTASTLEAIAKAIRKLKEQ